MKIDTTIDTREGRIYVLLESSKFTALEEQLIGQFGDPLVEIGGTFTGSVTVPGWLPTALVITPNAVDTAVVTALATPKIDGTTGAVAAVVVNAIGAGYTVPPVVTATGDGAGAEFAATIVSGNVTGITVLDGGRGYHDVPWTGTFQLATAQRRLQADFPVQQVFDTADFEDAEAKALCWASTLQLRMTEAIQGLKALTPAIDGETGITV